MSFQEANTSFYSFDNKANSIQGIRFKKLVSTMLNLISVTVINGEAWHYFKQYRAWYLFN